MESNHLRPRPASARGNPVVVRDLPAAPDASLRITGGKSTPQLYQAVSCGTHLTDGKPS